MISERGILYDMICRDVKNTFALFSMPQVGGTIASRSSFYIAIADMGDDIQSGFKNNMHLTGPLHHKVGRYLR
jgi:hypothetical protein